MGKTKTKIHARRCKVVKISNIQASNFLNENNLYGMSEDATVHYGLIHNGELVCLAAFVDFANRDYRLDRFSIKNNTHIPGAVTKLISSFVSLCSPKRITAINDNNWGYSGVYEKAGFTKTNEIAPAAVWVDTNDIQNMSSAWLPEFSGNDKITLIWDCGYTEYSLVDEPTCVP